MIRMAIVAVLVALAGCAGLEAPKGVPDQLAFVVEAATLRVQRSTAMYQRGQLKPDVAAQRLSRAVRAEAAMQEALALIGKCEGTGGCDTLTLRRELTLSGLDQLEAYLMEAGEVEAAEAAGAARIVFQMMSASTPPATGDPSYSSRFAPLVARFSAAVSAFRAAAQGKPA